MQGSEFVISRWNELHKVLLDQLRVGFEGMTHIFKDDPLLCSDFLDLVIDRSRIKLPSCSSKVFLLCFRDSELLESSFDLIWHLFSVISVGLGSGFWLCIID